MKNLQVVLDNESYFPGSIVSGKLIVDLDVPKKYKLIEVGITGKAETFWSETLKSGDSKTTSYYENTEEYINTWLTVWQKEDTPNGVLPSGVHSFPFQFTLPHNVPSSYEGGFACIRYTIHGRIRTGSLKFDHSTDVTFPVSQVVSINEPCLQKPSHVTKEKSENLFCASGPVSFTFELPRTGFCVGKEIPLTVNIKNGSLRKSQVVVSLVRREVFRASRGQERVIQDRLVEASSHKINPKHSTAWTASLPIPENLSPTMKACSSISVEYYLEVMLKVSWAKSASVAIVPIVIGNTL